MSWGDSGGGWGDTDSGWGDAPAKPDRNSNRDVPKEGFKKRFISNNDGDEADGGGGWGGGQRDGFKKRFKSENGGEPPPDENKKRYTNEDGEEIERPAPYKPEELNLEEEVELQGNVGENFQRYNEQKVTCIPRDVIKPIEKFTDIIESKLLMSNIEAQKYTAMTPIQKWAMPAIMNGLDLIACAQTGSGKTAAFLLPILQTLLKIEIEPNDPNSDCQNPYCLIISPTRELANQINIHGNMLSRDSIVKCQVIYGGVSTPHLKAKISSGCHILVATPGRLKDFVSRGWIGFKNIKYIILDEGDRLVDEGFTTDIQSFFEHHSMPPMEERQTLFFSATFKESTQLSAKKYLKSNFVFLTVGRVGAANENINQEFIQVAREEKKRELKKILAGIPESEKTIVFTQTKNAADMLAGFFNALKLSSTSIHGDRHQSQREQAIRSFKKGEKRFLISSPVGNRGLDLPKVAIVINYDLPNNIDEYVHRIGRTGRAGHVGRAISFYEENRDRELLPQLIEILTEAKQPIPDWMQGQGGATDSGFGESNTAGPQDDWDKPTASAANNDDDWDKTDNKSESDKKDSAPTKSKNDDGWNASSNSKKDDGWGAPSKPEGSWGDVKGASSKQTDSWDDGGW